jgi:putative alpha-1,2-mannosidase
MQGNLIWNLLGLYPVSTQPILLLSAPFFKSVDVKLGTVDGGVLKIRAPNLNATNIYPQSITVNGKQINTSWIWSDEVYYGVSRLRGNGRASLKD